ncbi:MAG: hypothetical protein JWO58_1229 [Chitinophagaceae bacterium]|nr:hypothetical protein [Chitinophagaceae bacterium]
MKTQKIIYWTSTGIFSAMMLLSAFMYFTSSDVVASFARIGFPSFFRIELGIAKFLGALALLLPFVPARIKEWAYAGFGITIISAVIAHLVSEPPATAIMPVVMFGVLVASYVTYHRLNDSK